MAEFFTVITEAGRQKLIESAISGTPVVITHLAVGSGSSDSPATQNALVSEEHRVAVNSAGQPPGFPARLEADAEIPGDVGGFSITEMGLITDDSIMLAYARTPPTFKPVAAQGASASLIARMVVDLSVAGDVAIEVQQVSGFAAQSWVQEGFMPRFAALVEMGDVLEYILTPSHLFSTVVFNSPDDIYVYLPSQATVATLQGAAVRMRNIQAGNIWLVPQEEGNAVQGAGNTTIDPTQYFTVRLEKSGAPNRWVSEGAALAFDVVPPIPEPPLINAVIGYDNETLIGYDGEPLEYYTE